MNLFTSISRFLSKKDKTIRVPEGFCPNCWGRQEYAGQLYEAIINENLDVNTLSERKGWIQDYVDKNLIPIQLVPEDDDQVCQKCKVRYQLD